MTKRIYVEYNVRKPFGSVGEWLIKDTTVAVKVGGLLDYGYEAPEVARMLDVSLMEVFKIMTENNYKTIDQLAVHEIER